MRSYQAGVACPMSALPIRRVPCRGQVGSDPFRAPQPCRHAAGAQLAARARLGRLSAPAVSDGATRRRRLLAAALAAGLDPGQPAVAARLSGRLRDRPAVEAQLPAASLAAGRDPRQPGPACSPPLVAPRVGGAALLAGARRPAPAPLPHAGGEVAASGRPALPAAAAALPHVLRPLVQRRGERLGVGRPDQRLRRRRAQDESQRRLRRPRPRQGGGDRRARRAVDSRAVSTGESSGTVTDGDRLVDSHGP